MSDKKSECLKYCYRKFPIVSAPLILRIGHRQLIFGGGGAYIRGWGRLYSGVGALIIVNDNRIIKHVAIDL